ncbi:DUF308 domain-containing protein [Enterococcus gilvus]|uniref:Integral membrane protein n=1 Tax=Enterococcus gilvus ATCC BAA-350 TaxID=1158614 RepID=R2XG18_9ENTE|nr:DUF308 domain-containing protein [Enterococcus gilvus]EOI53553.1 hypothetical protein UKC_03505 [Enterococcus gilvus ATCC BAA-350]EOW81172.1 hypothetical protein I592_00457 [Enterococcus gilvus ATCC BAA-350]
MKNIKQFFESYRFLQILTGGIYLIMALLAMHYTEDTIVESVRLFGAFSLIKGFFEIMNRTKISMRTHKSQYSALAIGFVDIMIGLILVVYTSLDLTMLSILFGFWFIGDSVISFFLLDLAKSIAIPYYYVSLVVDLIGCMMGLLLLVGEGSLMINVPSLIGNYFLLFGFTKLIGGVINVDNLHSVK